MRMLDRPKGYPANPPPSAPCGYLARLLMTISTPSTLMRALGHER
jgi:hypothetical protein